MFMECTRDELVDVSMEYSRYVTEFFETHDEGSQPVSIEEFYLHEYKTPLKREAQYLYDLIVEKTERDIPDEDIIDEVYKKLQIVVGSTW